MRLEKHEGNIGVMIAEEYYDDEGNLKIKLLKNPITADIEKLDRRIADWLKKTNTCPGQKEEVSETKSDELMNGMLNESVDLKCPED